MINSGSNFKHLQAVMNMRQFKSLETKLLAVDSARDKDFMKCFFCSQSLQAFVCYSYSRHSTGNGEALRLNSPVQVFMQVDCQKSHYDPQNKFT